MPIIQSFSVTEQHYFFAILYSSGSVLSYCGNGMQYVCHSLFTGITAFAADMVLRGIELDGAICMY